MTPHDVLHRCPLCQAEYQKEAVVCLEEGMIPGKPRLFHCVCSGCKRSMVALLVETSGWLSSIGMLTELSVEEARVAKDAQAIQGDHCVRTHVMLEESSEAFCAFLLKQAENTAKRRS